MATDFQLGSIPLTVRSLDKLALAGLPGRFTALVPCFDVKRLPSTLEVLMPLLRAGCADLILAGPRAAAFEGQVGLAIEQQGVVMQVTAYDEVNDACNALLLGALVHRGGVALVADDPKLVDQLQGHAGANGWMNAVISKPRPIATTKRAPPRKLARAKAVPETPAKKPKKR